MQEVEPTTSDKDASSRDEYRLFMTTDRSSEPTMIPVVVKDKKSKVELNTGAVISIISDQTQISLFLELQLRKSSLVLKTYTDEQMNGMRQLNVRVKYGNQEEKLVLVVVDGDGPNLFGHNWLKYCTSN